MFVDAPESGSGRRPDKDLDLVEDLLEVDIEVDLEVDLDIQRSDSPTFWSSGGGRAGIILSSAPAITSCPLSLGLNGAQYSRH